jgi:inner membrane protein
LSPITHLLASWTAGDVSRLRNRDLTLVTLCGLLPDADGAGLILDLVNRAMGRSSYYYFLYHHEILHGLFGAIIIPLALCAWATNRVRVLLVGFLVVHLHLLCDALGSRGPGAGDLWPIPYFAPFTKRGTIQWVHQWPLDAWPNFAFTVLLMVYVFVRAARSGYSPVAMFSAGAERVFVETVQNRWRAIRRTVFRKISVTTQQ